jgi:hypothetical protein
VVALHMYHMTPRSSLKPAEIQGCCHEKIVYRGAHARRVDPGVSLLFLRLCTVALLLAGTALAGCGGRSTAASPDPVDPTRLGRPAPLEPMQSMTTQVVFFAVVRGQRQTGWATTVALDAALREFEPDVILADCPPDAMAAVMGGARPNPNAWPWADAPEVLHLLMPFAQSEDIALEGISGETEDSVAQWHDYWARDRHGPPHRVYLLTRARAEAMLLEGMSGTDPSWMYSERVMDALEQESRWLSYFVEAELGLAGELRSEARHAAIMSDALTRYRGQRIAIVFDVRSRYSLEGELLVREGVDVVPAAQIFEAAGLSATEMPATGQSATEER